MEVQIRSIGLMNTVSISCSKPKIIEVVPQKPISVTISLTKDGIDGLSAYQIAVKNGKFIGTEEEFAAALIPDLSIFGNPNRDFAQDFLMALNT